MTGHLVWIIDEEWAEYDTERELLREWDPQCDIRFSGYDYANDLEAFGYRADLILAQVYAPIPRSTIERLECCKGIALFGGGYDRVDVDAAAERGIPVTNVHGYCKEDLADYVLAAMFRWNKPQNGYAPLIASGLHIADRRLWAHRLDGGRPCGCPWHASHRLRSAS